MHDGTRKFIVCALILVGIAIAPLPATAQPKFGAVNVGAGITLHYVEQASGNPVIFVHGSLSDFSYWRDQVTAFSKHYRSIAYSRRYNWPNANPAWPNYSAVTDSEDLVGFIRAMHLKKVYLIGHSYGALAALFLAVSHPDMIRAVILAEPPAVSLLNTLPGEEAPIGRAFYADIQRRMVIPMKTYFSQGKPEAGVAAFIDYVFNDSHAWEKMSAGNRTSTMRDAHEWDVMMTHGILFPAIAPEAIANIRLPVLVMSGAKSYPFLTLLSRDLARLIPGAQAVTFPGAGHQMWYQRPEECRNVAEKFFRHVRTDHESATFPN